MIDPTYLRFDVKLIVLKFTCLSICLCFLDQIGNMGVELITSWTFPLRLDRSDRICNPRNNCSDWESFISILPRFVRNEESIFRFSIGRIHQLATTQWQSACHTGLECSICTLSIIFYFLNHFSGRVKEQNYNLHIQLRRSRGLKKGSIPWASAVRLQDGPGGTSISTYKWCPVGMV